MRQPFGPPHLRALFSLLLIGEQVHVGPNRYPWPIIYHEKRKSKGYYRKLLLYGACLEHMPYDGVKASSLSDLDWLGLRIRSHFFLLTIMHICVTDGSYAVGFSSLVPMIRRIAWRSSLLQSSPRLFQL